MQTILTDAGLNAAVLAGTTGPTVNVTSVKIGSSIVTPTSAMTDVTGLVWTGDSTYIRYQVQDDGLFAFKITLDEGIGDFEIGNIGLFLDDGTMFTITSMDKVALKIKNDTDVTGNRISIVVPIKLAGISNLMNVTVLVPDESSIPFVQTQNDLPDPSLSAYSVYEVLNHTVYNVPVLALRTSTQWAYVQPQSTDSVPSFPIGMFDDDVEVGMPVYFDSDEGLFKLADGLDDSKGYIGLRGSLNNIVTNDTYYNADWLLTPGTYYYADGGANAGLFTTVPNKCLIGRAITNTTLLLDVQNESRLNKVMSINASTPSTVKYPNENAVVQYVSALIQQLQNQISASGVAISSIIASVSNSIPSGTGWLLCNGQTVSRATYSGLFAIIGTSFGAGNGTTTFKLPDYRGKFLRGLGGNSGATVYTPQAEGLPNITASVTNISSSDVAIPTTSGAFSLTSVRTDGYSNGLEKTFTLNFNASLSNGIYGASSHVTPENYAVHYYIKAI